jgi:tRNA G10  N-methylase Trm11
VTSLLHLSAHNARPLPPEYQSDDVRFGDAFVAHFVKTYSPPGGVVLDPFAGYGTTLVVAEALGRAAYGLELDPGRAAYARGLLAHPERLALGDARRLGQYAWPPVDLLLTSPPYMARGDAEDPLAAYQAPGRGYDAYLLGLQSIFAQAPPVLRPGGHVVIEAANLKGAAGVTPLAWDIARTVSAVLTFEGEIVIAWDRPSFGYDHSYALIFTAG